MIVQKQILLLDVSETSFKFASLSLELLFFYFSVVAYGYISADFMQNPHDPLGFIDPRSRAFNSINAPIPVPMLMPTAPMPPSSFFNPQPGNQVTNASGKGGKKFNNNRRGNNRTNFRQQQQQQVNSQASGPRSQDDFKSQTQNTQETSQAYSQSMLTQGPLSQGFLSQQGLSQAGFSQAEYSQDSYLEHFQSQADGLLSQDSNYRADPSFFAQSQSMNSQTNANHPGRMSQF